MGRFYELYIIAFAGLVAGANVSGLSFFTPLCLVVLLLRSIGLWQLDNRPSTQASVLKERIADMVT